MRNLALSLLAACVSIACNNVDTSALTTIDAPPEATFGATADPRSQQGPGDFLIHRCGTLDCHGQAGRNLRLYGQFGLRLDPNDTSQDQLAGGVPTTPDEYDSDYRSVVGLEPEQMSLVVQGQADPETLLLLAKPLGLETHKGMTLIEHGDDQEHCIVDWILGSDPTAACTSAYQNNI